MNYLWRCVTFVPGKTVNYDNAECRILAIQRRHDAKSIFRAASPFLETLGVLKCIITYMHILCIREKSHILPQGNFSLDFMTKHNADLYSKYFQSWRHVWWGFCFQTKQTTERMSEYANKFTDKTVNFGECCSLDKTEQLHQYLSFNGFLKIPWASLILREMKGDKRA